MEASDAILVSGAKRVLKAQAADLSGSSFTDVNLAGATFNTVNMAGAQIEDANLSDWSVRNANLTRLRLVNADLRNASLTDCLTTGMTVDGVALSDLVAAYRALTVNAD